MNKNHSLTPRTALFGGAAIISAALTVYGVVVATAPSGLPREKEDRNAAVQTPRSRSAGSSQGGGWARAREFTKSRSTPRKTSAAPSSFDEEPLSPDAPFDERKAQVIRFEEARESSFLAEFNGESVDSAWATTWESSLTTSLEGALAEYDGFDGMSVECRRERCVAQAKWKSFSAAQAALGAASDATKGACATSVFVPPPDDPKAPYEHRVRFSHCQDEPI